MSLQNINSVIITGIAGFIGFHLAKRIAKNNLNTKIIGVDNLNDYYSVKLKRDRLKELEQYHNVSFVEGDVADFKCLKAIAQKHADIELIFHLAAQAGVRASVDQPFKYINSNLIGQVCILEFAKLLPELKRIVYASSSSVYGSITKVPFKEDMPLEKPLSLYSATKQADELMCDTYSRLFNPYGWSTFFYCLWCIW
ncbi:MAG: GDP-mannose 4,6-dehydratase [Rickettsiales bacterium]|nr:GDP-mannose 4,6-dehydratase [Rickettsiales bacterium]